MNPIYIFLFIVMLVHGYGAQPNDEHSCDPLAMNISRESIYRVGVDADNQSFPIRDFLFDKKSDYNVARATPTQEIADPRDGDRRFCHVPYYERSCGPLRHTQKFLQDYDPDREEGLLGVQLHISMVGMSLETGSAIQYEMDVVGINKDDYIFQWIEGTPITAYEIDEDGQKIEISAIPEEVLERLKTEFAIYAIDINSKDDNDDASRSRGESEESEDEDIAITFVIFITCDGKSIWASYNKWIVDQDSEADAAVIMDEKIGELQDAVKELGLLNGNHPNVKPVSTYMPVRFDAAT